MNGGWGGGEEDAGGGYEVNTGTDGFLVILENLISFQDPGVR